jgi:hypothetical protein
MCYLVISTGVELERHFRTALCDKEPSFMAPCCYCICDINEQSNICYLVIFTGVELERHFRTALCDKEPSVMAATLNALQVLAAANPAPFR